MTILLSLWKENILHTCFVIGVKKIKFNCNTLHLVLMFQFTVAENPIEDAEVEASNLIDIFSPEENTQEGQQQLEGLTQQPDC